MHIPDGFLDVRTCAGTLGLTAGGVGWATIHARRHWNDRTLPLLGVMSAFIFAGQMVNFPVAGGTSGHLMGGTLAAVLLGPSAAVLALTTVLAVQCLLFQDGGMTALGANILNLSLIAAGSGYLAFRGLQWLLPSHRWVVLRAGLAAWVSVLLASGACAAELAVARTVPFRLVFPAMTLTHAVIGIGEALITMGIVSFLTKVRPDLLYQPKADRVSRLPVRKILACGLAAAAGVALLLAPFASSLPDGLERVAGQLGFGTHGGDLASAPLRDYAVPGLRSERLATALAGIIGVLAVFVLASGGAWTAVIAWRRRPGRASRTPPDC